ncbi:MAG: hypothetical protein ABIP49_02605 [Lysobacterales bacterium]
MAMRGKLRRPLIAGVLLCAGFVLALLWWFARATFAEATSTVDSVAVDGLADKTQDNSGQSGPTPLPRAHAIATQAQSSIARARDAPPPLNATVASFFKEADRSAVMGDRQAACRLGFDLALCASIEEIRDSKAVFEVWSATDPRAATAPDGYVEHLSLMHENIERAERICKGLTPEQIASSWKYLTRAAELGDHDAAAYFVFQPPLSQTHFFEDLDGWLYFRSNYQRLIERGIAGGNPQALFMAQRQAFGLPPISIVQQSRPDANFPEDPLLGLTYSLVLARISDAPNAAGFVRNGASARALLTAAEIRSAVAAADAMYERSFKQHRNLDFESGPTRDFDAKKCYDG